MNRVYYYVCLKLDFNFTIVAYPDVMELLTEAGSIMSMQNK